ncbi:SURF1 family protein [Leptothrix sp. BB-4]
MVLVAAITVCAVTARLGIWQLDRADQKTRLQQQIDSRHALPPLAQAEWPAGRAADPAFHDRLVTLHGRWRHDGTVYLENRQMQGRPGFHVVTPLLLGPDDAVMVVRGWIPRDAQDRTRLAPVPTPAGDVTLQGRIAPPPSKLYDFGDAGQGAIRQNLDLAAHASALGLPLRPASILQTDPVAADEAPLLRDWPLPAVDIHKHLGYAAQWFALSALCAGLYVWFQLIRPRLQQRRRAPA